MEVVAVSSPFSYLSIIFDMASNRLGDSGLPLVSHDTNISTIQSNRTQYGFRKGTSILEREENRITTLIMENSLPKGAQYVTIFDLITLLQNPLG